jgi:exodeoxyribonuclease-3
VAVNLLIKNKNIRLINVYVPNGESLESDKFQFKLLWLDFFHQYIELTKQKVKYDFLLVCGDFNIAPLPCDISSAWKSPLLRSPQELTGFEKLLNCGLIDVLGQLDLENEPLFTWWDYRMKSFERNLGLRIDHWLIDSEAFEHLSQCWVDKKPRTQEKPSDHIPVCITLQLS